VRSRPTEASDPLTGFAELSFLDAGGYISGPLSEAQNLSFAAAFRRSVIDALLPVAIPDDAALSFATAPHYYDGQLRVDWRPERRHRLSVFALGSLDRLDFFADSDNARDPVATGQGISSTDFSRLIGTWRFRDGGLDSTTTTYVGNTDVDVSIGDDRYLRTGGWSIGARHDTRWRLHPRASLEIGGDASRTAQTIDVKLPLPREDGFVSLTNDPPLEGSFDALQPRAAAYAAAELSPTTSLSVTPGLRLDYYGYLGQSVLQPRLQSSLWLGSRWTLRGALGEYSRDLRRDDLLADYLSPERARHLVLGGDYALSDVIQISGSAYYTAMRDLVVRDFERAQRNPLLAWENSGRGRTYGVETLVSARTDQLYGWLSYTYARSYRRDGPDAPDLLFEFDRPHNFLAVASYKRGPWRFGGRFRLASGPLTTPVVGSIYVADTGVYEPILGERNSERFLLAHQLDVRVDRLWTFDAWRLSVFLDVTNAYARPQVLGYLYNFDYTERERLTDLPILPALGVRGSF
jgi:hypothetical protein